MWTNLALLFLRIVVGGLFIGHGAQKAFGWFGGPGFAGTAGWMESMGMKPARLNAFAAAFAEMAGGVLLVLGIYLPLAALLIVGVMLVAIKTVHLSKGIWNSNGGFEYNLTLIAAAVTLAATGPGADSLQTLLSH